MATSQKFYANEEIICALESPDDWEPEAYRTFEKIFDNRTISLEGCIKVAGNLWSARIDDYLHALRYYTEQKPPLYVSRFLSAGVMKELIELRKSVYDRNQSDLNSNLGV